MKRVFLSCAKADVEQYELLAQMLEQSETEVFRVGTLPAGDDWQSEVLAAIRSADGFVAAMDDLHPNVLFELGYALGAGKPALLLRGPGTKLPLDVAAVPVKTIERLDAATAGEIADWVQGLAGHRDSLEQNLDARTLFEAIEREPTLLDALSPSDFEKRVVDLLSDLGLETRHLPPRSDQGFDIEVFDEIGRMIAVEVKKQTRHGRVSVNDVQRVVGASVVAGADAALLITAGGFTSSAHHFSDTSPFPIQLIDLGGLLRMDRGDLLALLHR